MFLPLVIEQATYAQLQEYNLGETFEKIPLFSQVLAQVNGRVPLIVEIKSTERIERTCLKVMTCCATIRATTASNP